MVAHWGNEDGYRFPHPHLHPHFLDPSPSLPISPFGENGDGGVLGGGLPITIPIFPFFPFFPVFPFPCFPHFPRFPIFPVSHV